jgi:hypothetical protein
MSYLHTLALPEHIVQDLEYEREADETLGRAHAVAAMIRDYNPRCELVWISERATQPGMIPARWAVKVHWQDKGASPNYLMWVGPGDSYREPDSSMIEWLRRQDLHRRDVVDEVRRGREAREAAARKRREEASAESIDHFATFAKSKINPGVSFNTARPWTNRVERLPGK